MRISLIIPAYNEQERLPQFLESVASYIDTHTADMKEILVVDDGSTDDTVTVAESFGKRIPMLRILKHEKNKGKGAAVQTGVQAATGDYIIFMDADGATDITELPYMIQALDTAQIGIGNRWMKGAKTQRHSALRSLSGWAYRTYMKLFGLGSIDTMCGFKGYRANVAKDLFEHLINERWLFDTEIAYKAVKKGYSVKNFPIAWESKDGSKLPTSTLLKSAFQIFPLIRTVNKQLRKQKSYA